MANSPRHLEDVLVEKLQDVGGLDEETAGQVAFDVVEELENEGFFDDEPDDNCDGD